MGREPPFPAEYSVTHYSKKTALVSEYRAPFKQRENRCEMLI